MPVLRIRFLQIKLLKPIILALILKSMAENNHRSERRWIKATSHCRMLNDCMNNLLENFYASYGITKKRKNHSMTIILTLCIAACIYIVQLLAGQRRRFKKSWYKCMKYLFRFESESSWCIGEVIFSQLKTRLRSESFFVYNDIISLNSNLIPSITTAVCHNVLKRFVKTTVILQL
ncbi:Carboxypeptidase vitellogenic like [Aphis craccivora]|uniref:Carboxypeptidase vitellogenic like n=1 Tax=Aphis craccivora TaxID=307492 RepID=A0A6G0XN18_APHCR|nr:Carboxypeptidase vitellogenic like [Aphis craccivora]